MASAPPLRTELHKIVIVLNGSHLKGGNLRRRAAYKRYMKAMRAVAKRHGARIESKQIHLKQRTIDDRKKALQKEARSGGK